VTEVYFIFGKLISAQSLRTPMKLLLIVAMAVLPLLASSAENREYVILLDEL
jgi:hypothetical protein